MKAAPQKSTELAILVASGWLLYLLMVGSACFADDSVGIVNRWKADVLLHAERGSPGAGEIAPAARSAGWWFEPVMGPEGYVRLRNRDSWQYLHAERQQLEMGDYQPGWWSAQWLMEPVKGTEFVRLRNRWLGTYLHIERGRLELGEIRPGWWSAQWLLQSNAEDRPPAQSTTPAPERPRTAPQFSGRTMGNEQLRADTYFHVALAFESAFDCPIERVHMATEQVQRNVDGDIAVIEETWSVSGCGNDRRYEVLLMPSPRGGFDISVGMRR
ncbi:MAG: hypothetical protein KDI71_03085 [Xanthomonadales bacterium]|nr:hypothetical protein [Xanthomonadales bacterium]